MVVQKFTLRERSVDWEFNSKFDTGQFPTVLQGIFPEVAWKTYIQKMNNDLKKFRAKKKDMVLIATALPTAMLTLIPWSIRKKAHSKGRNEYLRLKTREFNAKYGKWLKMNWSLEQQKMTITRPEINMAKDLWEISPEWEEEEESNTEEKSTVWYCAYGKNMSRDNITKRMGAHEIMGKPVVVQFMGKQLVFNKQSSRNKMAGFANLENKHGGLRAEAVLWPITLSAIYELDKFEGTPTHYKRETWISKDYLTNESLKDAPKTFQIYIANPARVRDNLRPQKEYLRHLQTGAKEFNFSESFLEMLSKVETLSE